MYRVFPESVLVTDVTHAVDAQVDLLQIALMLLLGFAVLAYIVSLFFVKSSLRNLKKLVEFAQDLDLDNLNKKIDLPGPDHDEIKILANSLNTSFKKVHEQAFALKDFVAHASHELKTPLMAMSTELDLAMKTKDMSSLKTLKTYLLNMDDLIGQLLLITRLESDMKLSLKNEKVKPVVDTIVEMIDKKYAEKHLTWDIDVKNVSVLCHL